MVREGSGGSVGKVVGGEVVVVVVGGGEEDLSRFFGVRAGISNCAA